MDFFGEDEINLRVEDFKRHLQHADRMIFSAKFGDGKSIFLQKIREDKERFSNYEFITIYPVNYVVAKNEDIFEYIKRDILIQLTKLKLVENIDIKKLLTSFCSLENVKEVLFFLVSSIPECGPIIKKLLEKAIDISKKYNDEKATYEKYFGTFRAQRGGLYEDDVYTQMIKEALGLLKNGYINEKQELITKKPVLIIEDLDRLDPAHLFRILNVISAHIDDKSEPDKVLNKFGFSNIVIVMDYDTTRHIFEHFYGIEASYAGYMSKFLSEEPFRYSISGMAILKLKDKIAREVGVRMEFLNAFDKLNQKLSNFSVRDVVRLYDLDLSTRIYKDVLGIPGKKKLSLHMPIFKLLIYMTEVGMNYGDIEEDLRKNPKYNDWDYLKLIYPLSLISKTPPPRIFDFGDKRIRVDYNYIHNDVIAEIELTEYYDTVISSNPVEVLDHDYAWYCKILDSYIDIAGFNRNKGQSFNIPHRL